MLRSNGTVLSGVRYIYSPDKHTAEMKRKENAYLVMSHNDRDMNEPAPSSPSGGQGGIGWELVMCSVYVGRVAKIVGVPRKR